MIAAKQNRCDHVRRWSTESQKELADAVGKDARTVAQWVRAGLPRWPSGGNRYRYCIPCTVQWLGSHGKIRTEAPGTVDELLLASAASSPNLERWRAARAEDAEMSLAERREQLVSIDVFRQFLIAVAAKYRAFGEEMVRQHGNGTAAMLQRLQGECGRLVASVFGPDDSGAESSAVVGNAADAEPSSPAE